MIMNRSLVPAAGGVDLFATHGTATEFYLNKFGPSQTKGCRRAGIFGQHAHILISDALVRPITAHWSTSWLDNMRISTLSASESWGLESTLWFFLSYRN